MKVRLETGELLVVEVPVDFATSSFVRIQSIPIQRLGSHPHPLVDVEIEDGLVGKINEHVTRRHAQALATEDRLVLWGHLVSKHATIVPLQSTLEELIEMHEREHKGPGTIRNHPRESREHSLNKIGKVLAESDQ